MRFALALIGITGALAGCAVDRVEQVGSGPREAITYAARAKYPGNVQNSETLRTAAIDRRDKGEIEILNLTTNSVPPSSVWVNGAFVSKIAAIPPSGSAVVKYGDLIEAGVGTSDLKSVGQNATKIELETPNGLYAVQGPSKQ